MESKKLLSLSIIILALSIVFSSLWIGQSLNKLNVQGIKAYSEKALLSEEEAAEYLNISVDEFRKILLKDNQEKQGLSVYSTYSFVPYIEIDQGKKMFNKEELNNWIKYKMFNK